MSKRSQQIDALFQHGQRCHMAGRLADAERAYRQVIAAAPRHADALHALGALALQAGLPDAAATLVGQAIDLKSAADFHLTRAHVFLALNRPHDAVQSCRVALRAKPGSAVAYQTLGHALSDRGDPDAAIEAYREALRLQADLPDLHNNLGTALRQANRLDEAEHELANAPPDPGALVNLSSVQKERGAFDRAEATLRRALAIAPADPILQYNWSLLMLLLNRPAEAWAGWEQRFRAGAVPLPPHAQPQWIGDSLGQRSLLVHAEQGLGDTIQFCRYLPAIAGSVAFEAPPKLIRLLLSNPAMPAATPIPPERFDVVAPLLSLPARMRERPASPPYLFAEVDRAGTWQAYLGRTGFRIGINWQGFSGRHEDKGRSIPLTAFRPLSAIPGIRLISLQTGEGAVQIDTAGFVVETLLGLDDGPDAFIDTAAVMQCLDLVVTSDTSVAHLAGALGYPVWVALRAVPDWRWLIDRPDSPWYPSMRLFRQNRDGDWTAVFVAIANALMEQTHHRGY